MASQIERVTAELRRRILSGELAPGERIRELYFAPELGASRTPLRLALGELEKQGLVETVGKRGFQVRRVTLDEVAQAIDVRGVLEGLAARMVAEAGPTDSVRDALYACVAEGSRILSSTSVEGVEEIDMEAWAAMNAQFHRSIVLAAGSDALRSALEHVTKAPLADASALAIGGIQTNLEVSFLKRAQTDHEDIVDAIVRREGARAEALMREHARRSRDNKRKLAERQHPAEDGKAPKKTSGGVGAEAIEATRLTSVADI